MKFNMLHLKMVHPVRGEFLNLEFPSFSGEAFVKNFVGLVPGVDATHFLDWGPTCLFSVGYV